jgi:hypothetical protein
MSNHDEHRVVGTQDDCRKLMLIQAAAWFYGNWKAETVNEREMQALMERNGFWPIKDEAALLALAASPSNVPRPWCPGCNNMGRPFRADHIPAKLCDKCAAEFVESPPKRQIPAEEPSYGVQRLVAWLEQKYKRHGEECDRQSAAMLLHLCGLLREALPYVEGDGLTTTSARVSVAERIQRQVLPECAPKVADQEPVLVCRELDGRCPTPEKCRNGECPYEQPALRGRDAP